MSDNARHWEDDDHIRRGGYSNRTNTSSQTLLVTQLLQTQIVL